MGCIWSWLSSVFTARGAIREELPKFLGYGTLDWKGVYPTKAPDDVNIFQIGAVYDKKIELSGASNLLDRLEIVGATAEKKLLEGAKKRITFPGESYIWMSSLTNTKVGIAAEVNGVEVILGGKRRKAVDLKIKKKEKVVVPGAHYTRVDEVMKGHGQDIVKSIMRHDLKPDKIAVVVGRLVAELTATAKKGISAGLTLTVKEINELVIGAAHKDDIDAFLGERVLLLQVLLYEVIEKKCIPFNEPQEHIMGFITADTMKPRYEHTVGRRVDPDPADPRDEIIFVKT